jgi:hypothetical protein
VKRKIVDRINRIIQIEGPSAGKEAQGSKRINGGRKTREDGRWKLKIGERIKAKGERING